VDPANLPVRLSRSCSAADAARAASSGSDDAASRQWGDEAEPPAAAAAGSSSSSSSAGGGGQLYLDEVSGSMGLLHFTLVMGALLGGALPVMFIRKRRGLGRGQL